MIDVLLGCDKKDCVYERICRKSIGYIKEGKFECEEYRDLQMFLNELVERNLDKQ